MAILNFSFSMRPPRWLAALSIAVGVLLMAIAYSMVVSSSVRIAASGATDVAAPDAPTSVRVGAAALALAVGVAYIAAPLLLGRGVWRTFLGGLLLAPSAWGWLVFIGPAINASPIATVIGGVSLSLLVLYFAMTLSGLFVQFNEMRRSSR